MSTWLFLNLAVFATVVIITGFIIPQILLIAFRKNLFDSIDQRKIHLGTVPRLGGIAFFPAILFTIMVLFGFALIYDNLTVTAQLMLTLKPFCFIVGAIVILFLVGMADDLIGVKFRAKFIAQFLASALVITGGIVLDNLHGAFWINSLQTVPAILLTALLIVFITNAINLIDGIDGLASGLSAIACAFYGYTFYNVGLQVYAMLSFATLGALVPFFCYNVFGNAKKHSKIFMGDTGALTIGLILGVLSIRICRVDHVPHNLNPAVVAFAPLLIPCLDVIRVYFGRIKAHKPPFLPDKTHIHHKLLALGLHQRVAMPVIVGTSLILTAVNYVLSSYINITLLFALDITAWTLANIALSRAIGKCRAAAFPA